MHNLSNEQRDSIFREYVHKYIEPEIYHKVLTHNYIQQCLRNVDQFSADDTVRKHLTSDIMEICEEDQCDLLEKPALLEFELIDTELSPSGAGPCSIVRYERSIFLERETQIDIEKDTYIAFTPKIDAWVKNGQSVFIIMTLFTYKIRSNDGRELMQGVICHDYFDRTSAKLLSTSLMRTVKEAASWYLGVQNAFKNRPTVYKKRNGKKKNHELTDKGNKPLKNTDGKKLIIVKPVKIKYEGETGKSKTKHRKKECPCWGVKGHYRIYESGKVIWIAPFKKGKMRDSQSEYQGRIYQLQERTPDVV